MRGALEVGNEVLERLLRIGPLPELQHLDGRIGANEENLRPVAQAERDLLALEPEVVGACNVAPQPCLLGEVAEDVHGLPGVGVPGELERPLHLRLSAAFAEKHGGADGVQRVRLERRKSKLLGDRKRLPADM